MGEGWRRSGCGSSSAGGHWGSGGKSSNAGRFLQFFIKNSAFSVYFGQYRYFETITPQLKEFEKQFKLTK